MFSSEMEGSSHLDDGGVPTDNQSAGQVEASSSSQSFPTKPKRVRATKAEMQRRERVVKKTIAKHGVADTKEIQVALGIPAPQVNTVLASMIHRGALITSKSTDDARKVIYRLKDAKAKTPAEETPAVPEATNVVALSPVPSKSIFAHLHLGAKLEVVGLRKDRLDLLVDNEEFSVLLPA